MCMYTSLVERTPAAGRHANFSAGVASASAINWLVTCFHSPSKPCQIPSGSFWADACAAREIKINTAPVFKNFIIAPPLESIQKRDFLRQDFLATFKTLIPEQCNHRQPMPSFQNANHYISSRLPQKPKRFANSH